MENTLGSELANFFMLVLGVMFTSGTGSWGGDEGFKPCGEFGKNCGGAPITWIGVVPAFHVELFLKLENMDII